MKLVLDIPKEFEKHFNEDRFEDSLKRIEADIYDCINTAQNVLIISGNYELELIDMLIKAFEKAKSLHSTRVPKGKPIYNDAPAQEAKWIYLHGDRNGDGDIIGIGECSNCHQPCTCEYYCPNCGVKLRWKD